MKSTPPDDQDPKKTLIAYWIEKAQESLESAKSEYASGRLSFAVNRVYYACFYALSAVLRHRDKAFKRHKGLRSALHRDLVKAGIVDERWGRFFDEVFESRQRGDYKPMVAFQLDQVKELLEQAEKFLKEMQSLMK